MKITASLVLASTLFLGACAAFIPPAVTPGESEANLVARMGKPTGIYQDGNTRLLEYRTNPGGQATWMFRVDSAGRVLGMEQVLTTEKFATIQPGVDDKESVLRKVGAPYERSYLDIPQLEVWTYMYRDQGVWDNLMHIHFTRDGKVKMLMNAPDLWRRPAAGGGFGM